MSQAPFILVVEDEPAIAQLLQFSLTTEGYRVVLAGDAASACDAIAGELPQLVLLDWMLPDEPGIALLREWRADRRTADMRVIMLTAKGLDEDKVAGLNAGADDYLTKPFSPRELLARIRALLRQSAQQSANKTFASIELNAERHTVTVEQQAVDIGQTEFRLLSFLMDAPGRIFSRKQLLDLVWGDQSVLEDRTVDVHIMRLRKSLGSAAHYLRTIRSAGYTLSTDPQNSVN